MLILHSNFQLYQKQHGRLGKMSIMAPDLIYSLRGQTFCYGGTISVIQRVCWTENNCRWAILQKTSYHPKVAIWLKAIATAPIQQKKKSRLFNGYMYKMLGKGKSTTITQKSENGSNKSAAFYSWAYFQWRVWCHWKKNNKKKKKLKYICNPTDA